MSAAAPVPVPHAPACPCCSVDEHHSAHERERNTILRLVATLLGGGLILNSYLAQWLFADTPERAELSALVGALFLGAPLVYQAVRDVLRGRLSVNELAALGVLASFALQYYAEAGLVALFLYLGTLIESRTALGARAAIEDLVRLTPRRARRVDAEGREEEVTAEHLRPGDRIRVRPGESVPADGEIVQGATSLNEASVTGESVPADKAPGDPVFAGTENYTGAIDVRVTTVGADTTLGKVRRLILEAEQTRLPVMTIIERNVQWYTPTILMAAGVIYFFTGSASAAIAALIAACPCALVMATPTAMVAGLSAAARLGILIKNVAHLESAGELTAVVCDKTGTLTTGELAVARLAPAEGVAPERLLAAAAGAERHSNHPVARAMRRVAEEAKLRLDEPIGMEEIAGRGVRARVGGKLVRVGRADWLRAEGIELPPAAESPAEGMSTLYVAEEKACLGWIGLADHTRPEARHAMEELREIGIRNITMLTGDRWAVARRVARELACTDVVAECLPAQKLELVESLKARGLRVAVIGDGVNDAPALAAGDLGIAMGAAGNDVAVNSASVALLNNDLRRLPFLMRLSRLVRRVVYQNLIFGLLFILAGVSLAAGQWLTPIGAAVFHCLGSLPVIFNSARIVRFGEELTS